MIPSPMTRFVELVQVFNRLNTTFTVDQRSLTKDVIEYFGNVLNTFDKTFIELIDELNLELVRFPGSTNMLGETKVWNEVYPVVRSDKIDRLRKLVESDHFNSLLEISVNNEAIRKLRKTHVYYLEKVVERSSYITEKLQRELVRELTQNVISIETTLSVMEQGFLIAEIMDDFFGYGPLGLFLRDRTLSKLIEMREDGSFWATGERFEVFEEDPDVLLAGIGVFSIGEPVQLELEFDDENHKHECLASLRICELHEKDDCNEYKDSHGNIFRLPKSYEPQKTARSQILESRHCQI